MAKQATVKKATATKEVVATPDIAKENVKGLDTKSSLIRFYLSKGYAIKDIAKHMNIKYQHVRNVSVTQLKKDIKK